MGPQKAAAAGVWRPCRIPGAWNGHSLPKVVAGMHAELGVEGYVASEPGSLVHPPRKGCLGLGAGHSRGQCAVPGGAAPWKGQREVCWAGTFPTQLHTLAW